MKNDCVFCERIATGQFDQENEYAVAFQPLNPVTFGHTLVVPKLHLKDACAQPYFTGFVMEFAAELAEQWFDSCNIITSIGVPATQSVFHLHIHLVPRRVNDGLMLPWTNQREY